jgi:cytochrome c oxidase subunit IV
MQNSHAHILPVRTYLAVAGALFVFTILTVAVSYLHLGGWNAIIALAIAGTKASLVALFFMHLKYDKKLHMIILLIAVIFVAIFIALIMFDTLRRADIYLETAQPIKEKAKIYLQAPADSSKPVEKQTH